MLEQLYSILNEFKNPKYFIEQGIYEKIRVFNNEKFEKKPSLDSEFFYEEVAFALMETQQENSLKGWESLCYGPIFSATNKDGSIISNPNIKHITPEMVSYWEKRSNEVDNPILQCRYAGLVWDFSQKLKNLKSNISFAHRFIDSITEMAHLGGDSFLKYKMERALRLAVSIDDQKRIISVRDAIIKYEDVHSEDNKAGTWGYSFDLLIGDKNLFCKVQLEKTQEEKIINELERKLKILSDKNLDSFNPHFVEHLIMRLVPYYKNKNDLKNKKRVLLIYKDSFLNGIKNNTVLAGSIWLEKVRKILFQYNLSKEAKDLESDIRTLQKEDLKYLKKMEVPVQIPRQEIDNYINELDKQSLSEALKYIAFSFIPNKEQSKDTVLKISKEYPLSFLFTKSIMDYTGRVVAKIEPIKEDLEGHIVHQISQSMQLKLHLIGLGLSHLERNKSLNENTLSEHLFKSPVFLETHHQIIKEGLTAYFNKNYIASCSILISQIESAIREVVLVAGGEIYRPAKNSKEAGFELRSLRALLRDEKFTKVFEKFNNNIPDFFKIILIDKRALNLRNSICHGHSPSTHLNQGVAIHIIHILLILSILRKK